MTSTKNTTPGLVEKMRNHPWLLLISTGMVILAAWTANYLMSDSRYRGVPKRAIAAIEAGDLALAKDSIEQALQHYFNALDLDPSLSELHGKIAEVYYRAGIRHMANRRQELGNMMFEQSQGYINRALANGRLDPNAIFVRGLLYLFHDNRDSAVISLDIADSLGLRKYELYVNLGYLYNEMGDLSRALSNYQKALDLRQDDPSTLFNLGELYFHFGNFSAAVKAYAEAAKLDPEDRVCQANYAMAIWKAGDPESAKKILNNLLTSSQEYRLYNAIAWALIDKNVDSEWGMRLANAANSLKRDNIESIDILGWGYYVTGDYENAVKYLNRSMIKKPSEEVRRRLQMAKDKLEETRRK